jgi:hypothetical protein
MDQDLKRAVALLIKELKADEGYRFSWQANIAMAFKDVYDQADDKTDIHGIANEGANRFLETLCLVLEYVEE